MFLHLSTIQIQLSSKSLTNYQQWCQIQATQRTTTKVISKSQCGKNACLAFLGETNFEKVKVKLGGLGVNMQLLHVWSVVFLLNSQKDCVQGLFKVCTHYIVVVFEMFRYHNVFSFCDMLEMLHQRLYQWHSILSKDNIEQTPVESIASGRSRPAARKGHFQNAWIRNFLRVIIPCCVGAQVTRGCIQLNLTCYS